ncbi:M48 family metalloprotease [Azospirillum doebereinerae]|uniref:M48 family metalloprotease n=1 Tax=Azospirillum doebereinerae TaxID=92933 RepID=UPI00384F23D4
MLDSEVVNAFALPGGYVYVTRGLLALAKDEAEVAGVLAHEIGHVTARHSSRRQTRQTITDLLAAGVGLVLGDETLGQLAGLGGTALTAGYSREQELEADQLGVTTLERAGYDPFAMATFLETLRRDTQYDGLRAGKRGDDGFDFFASHPQTEDRVRRAADLARARPPRRPAARPLPRRRGRHDLRRQPGERLRPWPELRPSGARHRLFGSGWVQPAERGRSGDRQGPRRHRAVLRRRPPRPGCATPPIT